MTTTTPTTADRLAAIANRSGYVLVAYTRVTADAGDDRYAVAVKSVAEPLRLYVATITGDELVRLERLAGQPTAGYVDLVLSTRQRAERAGLEVTR